MGLTFKNNPALQNDFVNALERGASVSEASKAVGISTSTAYKVVSENAELKHRTETARAKFLRETAAEMRLRAPEAIATLLGVMHNAKTPATAKVSAARSILDYAKEFGDAVEFEQQFSMLSGELSRIKEGVNSGEN